MTVETPELTEKQVAYRTLERLPESATLEEISEELAILAAIRRGERAAEAGQFLTHSEVVKRSEAWIGK